MRGVRSKKRTGGAENHNRAGTELTNVDSKANTMQTSDPNKESELTTAKAIQNLCNNIKEMQNDIIAMKNDIKQDLSSFKSEINKKLEEVSSDICNQAARLTEAEQRVNELETVNIDLRDSLSHCLKQQKILQDKVTDLEGRSRRNNIRIYGIKEEAEGNAMQTFIENFLKEQLSINQDLQIQRAHRSLGPRPRDASISRSILVNFHRFDTKEKVLKAAWGKKIFYEGKLISFAHDLPTEINNKLKEYKNIKKILKEGKIRFQTPYPAKMRIHWDDGPHLYASASEAAADMRKRGYKVDMPQSSTANEEPAITQDPNWNKAGTSLSKRVRESLREFQREQV